MCTDDLQTVLLPTALKHHTQLKDFCRRDMKLLCLPDSLLEDVLKCSEALALFRRTCPQYVTACSSTV